MSPEIVTAFWESWFDKQDRETLGEAMQRRAMQPSAVFWWVKDRLAREQHDPGDEDVQR